MDFDIIPFPKPRMTDRGRFSKRATTYYSYANMLRTMAKVQGYKMKLPLSITFVLPMAKSWPEKKKKEMDGKPHTQRPDLDNLIKAFKDALLEEDSHVWCYGEMKKVWGREGKITTGD